MESGKAVWEGGGKKGGARVNVRRGRADRGVGGVRRGRGVSLLESGGGRRGGMRASGRLLGRGQEGPACRGAGALVPARRARGGEGWGVMYIWA